MPDSNHASTATPLPDQPNRKNKTLTFKQQRFVREYLKDFNATQACIRAGYSERNANKIGPELLGKTRSVIAAQQQQLQKTAQMTKEQWVKRLEWLSRAPISQVVEWDEAGVKIKPSAELSEAEKWLISEVSEVKGKYGNSIKIKLTDKLSALTELGKALGYYPDKKEKAGDTYNQINLTLQKATDPMDLSVLSADEKAQFRALLEKMTPLDIVVPKGLPEERSQLAVGHNVPIETEVVDNVQERDEFST